MSTQGEEVVVASELFDAEQFAPNLGQLRFQFTFRRCVGLHRQCVGVRRRQGLAIQFAVGGERQCIQLHVGGGEHVVGQACGDLRAQVFGAHCVFADHIGDQTGVAGDVLAGEDHGFVHARAGAQRSGDVAQFDAEAAQLDLVVVAAEELQHAIGAPARQVAGLVHALSGMFGERVGEEAFGGQIRASQVTACQLRTGDEQRAAHAEWDQMAVCVEQAHAGVGQGTAERHEAAGVVAEHRMQAGPDGGFGRSVQIPQWRTAGAQALGEILAQAVAAAEQAQSRMALPAGIQQHLPERGGGLHHRDGLLLQVLSPAGRILHCSIVGDNHASALHQRGEQFQAGDVEADGGHRQQTVFGRQRQLRLHRGEELGQRGVADHHALGLAGGAGGIDDVGRMLRMQRGNVGGVGGGAVPPRDFGIQQHRVHALALRQR